MKARVEKDLCIGDASCVETCPEVFEMRDDGLAYVRADADYVACGDRLVETAESCPVGAIILED